MKTLLILGLIGLILLIMVLSVVGVHYAETRKIRERLGKSQAHPDTAILMNYIEEQQEATRQHISAQVHSKQNDVSTTKMVVIEIKLRLEELIRTLNNFVRGIK